MRKIILLGVLFVLLLPAVLSFDCSLVSEQDYCYSVQTSDVVNKDAVYSALLYPESSTPNHNVIKKYNGNIDVSSKPYNSNTKSSAYIKNAWISFSWLSPSVYVDDELFVTALTQVHSDYDYDVQLPQNYYANSYPQNSNGDCQRTYSLQSNSAEVNYYFNDEYRGTSEILNIDSSGEIRSELTINVEIEVKHYWWQQKWSWGKKKWFCKYHHTSYGYDSLAISESRDVTLYDQKPIFDVAIIDQYSNTTKGEFSVGNYSTFTLDFEDSRLTKQHYTYSVVFEKQPLHIAFLEAKEVDLTKADNIYIDGNTFYLKNINTCLVTVQDHFSKYSEDCNLVNTSQEHEAITIEKRDVNLNLLWYILIFLGVCYIIYKLLKSQAKKIILPILLLLLLLPTAIAEEKECSITNLGSCVQDTLQDFLLLLFNAPIAPLLAIAYKLLFADVAIHLFKGVWSIITYILSFFYIFFFIYAGYTLLLSNVDPIKRAHAKELLKDTILMIILINGSYYIYDSLLDISVNMSSVIVGMIDPTFFLLPADNILNVGMWILTSMIYVFTLLGTIFFLLFRYIVICLGVIFFPIGIFCFYVPPLKPYGRFIMNLHLLMMFITFFDLLIILACSKLLEMETFSNMKTFIVIACFMIVNYTLWLVTKFAIKRAVNTSLKDDIGRAAKYIAALL